MDIYKSMLLEKSLDSEYQKFIEQNSFVKFFRQIWINLNFCIEIVLYWQFNYEFRKIILLNSQKGINSIQKNLKKKQ